MSMVKNLGMQLKSYTKPPLELRWSCKDVHASALVFLQQMQSVQPQGPYRLVGYSYGACVAFEMATLLQRGSEQASSHIRQLALLDGSHRYMKMYRDAYRAAYGVAAADLLNDALFESEALCGFALRFAPDLDYGATRRDLLAADSFDRRVALVVERLMQRTAGLFRHPDTVRFAATSLCRKMQAADR